MSAGIDRIALWPRLVAAAQAVNVDLANALSFLAQQGASATIRPDGWMQLGAGSMDRTAYERIRNDELAPREAALVTVNTLIRHSDHPWLPAIANAADDLTARSETATTMLVEAARKGDTPAWLKLLPQAMRRYLQTELVARVLADIGYDRYLSVVERSRSEYVATAEKAVRAGIGADPNGVYWPMQTPGGWLWVVDWLDTVPQVTNLGGEIGKKAPLQGEPVITAVDLARALAPIETAMLREAS